MNNIKVVIAEDEPPMGRFIKNEVEKNGFSVCSVCENAESILSFLKKNSVDLLITDICMPGCSGLELIRQIKKEYTYIQFIIISGYKEFDYAKEAIELGVEAYLTKPINLDELRKALQIVSGNITTYKTEVVSQNLERAFITCDLKLIKRLFPYKYCSVISVFNNETVELFSPNGFTNSIKYKNVTFFLFGRNTRENRNTQLEELEEHLKNIVSAVSDQTCTLLFVRTVEADDKLYESLHSIYRRTLKNSIFGERIYKYFDTISDPNLFVPPDDEDLKHRITAELEAKNVKRLNDLLTKLFALWESNKTPLYYIMRTVRRITEKVEQTLLVRSDNSNIHEMTDDIVLHADSFNQCCNLVIKQIQKIAEEARQEERLQRLSMMGKDYIVFNQIVKLVEENQDKNYSLQELCQLFNLSSPYIRSLFKKYSGLGYKEYILNSKIDLAKKIIQANPNVLIKDVAASIGYEQLYFTTVFSKVVGLSPTAYKQQILDIDNTKVN